MKDVTSPFPLYRPDDVEPVPYAERFDLILADPPWDYDDKNSNGARGASHKYACQVVTDLARLDVAGIAAPDSILAMWATWPTILDAFRLMEAWGFSYLTIGFVWVKLCSRDAMLREARKRLRQALPDAFDKGLVITALGDLLKPDTAFGLGRQTRGNTEVVLLGRRGKGLARADLGVRQVVEAEPQRCCPVHPSTHSVKPDDVHERLERLYGAQRRLEMFARRPAPGWTTWGNEIHAPDGTALASGTLMPLKPGDTT